MEPTIAPQASANGDILGAAAAPLLDLSRPIESRERAIPIRPADLTRLLLAEPGLGPEERGRLEALAKTLGAVLHHEFFAWLVELKDLYSPLDPDSDCLDVAGHSIRRDENSDEAFLKPFEAALVRANYRELAPEVIEEAIEAPNEMGLTYVPNFQLFDQLKVYVRGQSKVTRVARTLKTKYRRRTVVLDGYRRVVVILKFKMGLGLRTLGPQVRSDVLYLRMFKDVPHVDMEMHLPEQGTKVKMRWIDKAQIASPIVVGLPTLAMKFMAATAGVGMFGLLALPTTVLGGLLAAPVTAGLNSFFGFQRAKQRHLSHMIRHLYYLNLASNASVIHNLLNAAQEEEFKEALLAYFVLWRGSGPDAEGFDRPRLDAAIEGLLHDSGGVEVDFEIGDALHKLHRLGLAREGPDHRLRAVPIEQALSLLDERWDDYFRFRHAPTSAG